MYVGSVKDSTGCILYTSKPEISVQTGHQEIQRNEPRTWFLQLLSTRALATSALAGSGEGLVRQLAVAEAEELSVEGLQKLGSIVPTND